MQRIAIVPILGLAATVLACAATSTEPESPVKYTEAGLIAEGYVRVTFPDPDPGIPAYARVTHLVNQFYHANGWLAIQFFRDPDCVPDDFDLLELFHFPDESGPGSFACPLRHQGRAYVEPGSPLGTFPILTVAEGSAVPYWFVRWSDFQAAMADGRVTMPELRAMSPRRGTAATHREIVQPRLEEHVVVTDATGRLDDGTRFEFHVTHVGDRTQRIRLEFQ